MKDRPWLPPKGREARNEQHKLRAAFVNAMAITLFVTAIAGPAINPVLAEALQLPERVLMAAFGAGLHLFASWILRAIEDK